MNYINTETLVVSDLNTLRYQHPNMSIPDGADLSDIGYEKVYPSRPAYDPATQYLTPLPPAQLDGTWTEQWQVNDLPPVVPIPLADRQNAAWQAIQAKRTLIKSSGVKVADKWFHTDVDSRIQQLGLVMMGANLPAVEWKTMDGTKVPMTPTLAVGIFQAVSMLDIAAFAAAETHKATMMLSETPESYDFSEGWPVVFSSEIAP